MTATQPQHSILSISGPCKLSTATIRVSGAKNAALPILAASLLADDLVCLYDIPHLKDTTYMLEALCSLGIKICLDENKNFTIDPTSCDQVSITAPLAKKMRTSLLFLGPLLSKYKQAQIPLPGGCNIGARPIDIHIDGLRKMGASIQIQEQTIYATAPKAGLHGMEFTLPAPSVGATQNLIMAATIAAGTTILHNIATEPEIQDLIDFLNNLGASIQQTAVGSVTITGKPSLGGGSHRIIGDRIQAGTYLIAACICQSSIQIQGVDPMHLTCVLDKLRQSGAIITTAEKCIHLNMPTRPQAVDVSTGPYPEFPTDLQAQWIALNCTAQGHACVTENIYENRMAAAHELQKLGANINITNNKAYTKGSTTLSANSLEATDIRASAGLILACLKATGTSTIHRVEHADRGYTYLEENLRKMGVKLQRTYACNELDSIHV